MLKLTRSYQDVLTITNSKTKETIDIIYLGRSNNPCAGGPQIVLGIDASDNYTIIRKEAKVKFKRIKNHVDD